MLIQCLFILLIIYRRIIKQIFPKQNRPQPYQQPPPVNNLAAANTLEDPQDSEMLPLYLIYKNYHTFITFLRIVHWIVLFLKYQLPSNNDKIILYNHLLENSFKTQVVVDLWHVLSLCEFLFLVGFFFAWYFRSHYSS